MNERRLRQLTADLLFNLGSWVEMSGEVAEAQVKLVANAIQPPRQRRKTPAEIAEQQESPWYKRVYGFGGTPQ
jgi:hypothetical protein